MSNEVLNPDVVCEDCEVKWTSEGAWVMDDYACPDDVGYCLNCCVCPDHDTSVEGVWYEPKDSI
jgi:hypothetical protein